MAALRADAMRHLRLLTVRADGRLRRAQSVVRAALARARFRMATFRIRHGLNCSLKIQHHGVKVERRNRNFRAREPRCRATRRGPPFTRSSSSSRRERSNAGLSLPSRRNNAQRSSPPRTLGKAPRSFRDRAGAKAEPEVSARARTRRRRWPRRRRRRAPNLSAEVRRCRAFEQPPPAGGKRRRTLRRGERRTSKDTGRNPLRPRPESHPAA